MEEKKFYNVDTRSSNFVQNDFGFFNFALRDQPTRRFGHEPKSDQLNRARNSWNRGHKTFHGRNLQIFAISYCVCPWQALSNVCGQGPSGAPERCFNSVGSGLTRKHQTRLERLARDKRNGADVIKLFICYLLIFVISQSVCPWKAFPDLSSVCGQGPEPTLEWNT